MSDQPNILLLWTDQHQRDALGAYGNEQIETPALDALAASGTVFEHAYCTSPVCTPSRSAVLTGQYPHVTGAVDNGWALPQSVECFTEHPIFAEYATGYMGKWDLGDELFPQHGFDEWISIEDLYSFGNSDGRPRDVNSDYHEFLIENGFEPDRDTDPWHSDPPPDGWARFGRRFAADLPEEYSKPKFLADRASRFIRDHAEEPFLLSVNFLEPHSPYLSPRDDQYDPADMPLPENFRHDGFTDQSDEIQTRRAERNINATAGVPNMTETEVRDFISRYWGLVSLVDTHIGRILDTLSDCGLDEETIVIYTSDHGDHVGSHGLVGKFTMFEESAAIPLLMRIPGLSNGGGRLQSPVSQIDFASTLIDAIGGTLDDWFQGTSWISSDGSSWELPDRDVFIERQVMSNERQLSRPDQADELYSYEYLRDTVESYKRAIVTPDRMKYVFRPNDQDSLYDLADDPHETENLAVDTDQRETLHKLKTRLKEAQDCLEDPLPGPSVE